uniref:Uncharacterized protein n=1 Tax=Arundo donax TaxID=35708 RepID=A0A0A9GQ53_ARUDO
MQEQAYQVLQSAATSKVRRRWFPMWKWTSPWHCQCLDQSMVLVFRGQQRHIIYFETSE